MSSEIDVITSDSGFQGEFLSVGSQWNSLHDDPHWRQKILHHLTSKNQVVSTGQDVVSNINHVSDKGGSIGRLLKHESQSHLLNFLLVIPFERYEQQLVSMSIYFAKPLQIKLVGAQPSPSCSFARHLVGKIAIHCSFAHH